MRLNGDQIRDAFYEYLDAREDDMWDQAGPDPQDTPAEHRMFEDPGLDEYD